MEVVSLFAIKHDLVFHSGRNIPLRYSQFIRKKQLYKTGFYKKLFLKAPIFRGSAHPEFTCSNSIKLTSTMYKVNNKDTRTKSFDVFLMLTLSR